MRYVSLLLMFLIGGSIYYASPKEKRIHKSKEPQLLLERSRDEIFVDDDGQEWIHVVNWTSDLSWSIVPTKVERMESGIAYFEQNLKPVRDSENQLHYGSIKVFVQ